MALLAVERISSKRENRLLAVRLQPGFRSWLRRGRGSKSDETGQDAGSAVPGQTEENAIELSRAFLYVLRLDGGLLDRPSEKV